MRALKEDVKKFLKKLVLFYVLIFFPLSFLIAYGMRMGVNEARMFVEGGAEVEGIVTSVEHTAFPSSSVEIFYGYSVEGAEYEGRYWNKRARKGSDGAYDIDRRREIGDEVAITYLVSDPSKSIYSSMASLEGEIVDYEDQKVIFIILFFVMAVGTPFILGYHELFRERRS